MWKFKTSFERSVGRIFENYSHMYDYSCAERAKFWGHCFEKFPLVYSTTASYDPTKPCVDENAPMFPPPKWFQGININFAQNILYQGTSEGRPVVSPGKEDDKIAVTEVREGSRPGSIRHVTWKELRQRVARMAQAMRARGVKRGDRVAVVASNSVDTLVVFLGVTALGGLFSSSSTDMGVRGILDRLLQIKPKYLFFDDWALYNGKTVDLRSKMVEVVEGMKGISEFRGIISQPRWLDAPAEISEVPMALTLEDFVSTAPSAEPIFEQVAFSDPFLIVYSSGTTGTPKCIVHSTGGLILSGHKEARLHRCIDETSTQLQYTTTGWIMYLLAVQALVTGARAVLYDGSPFVPRPENFLRLIGDQKVTHLGVSPRYFQTLQQNEIVPKSVADLRHLKVITSTGMVLSDALFEWFYDTAFPPSVRLDNIAGGTDLAGAFGTGNPILPIYVGGCQCLSLGLPVQVMDQTVESGNVGVKVDDGVPGELVATNAFPNMPVKFWGENAQQRYFDGYFARFKGVWTHGDFIMMHPITKNVLFLGRADGVLNPSGVRFGSAEIYTIIDAHFGDMIQDSLCVGQRRPDDNDESVILFLLMQPGKRFTSELVQRVNAAIKNEMSPRHVPKYTFETPDIPVSFDGTKAKCFCI
jgi:acetoacetyl-CoA synthetase